MTLAEAIICKDSAVLLKNVFCLMGIYQEKYRQPVIRAVEEIINLAHAVVENSTTTQNVIFGYCGYRETIPACFADMVSKDEIRTKLKPIDSWDGISPIWIPLDERQDFEKLTMEQLAEFVPGVRAFDVTTIPLEDIAVMLGAEIYSAIPFLVDRIPETALAVHLIKTGHVAFGWMGLCHISAGTWDLKQLSEDNAVLHYLCTEPFLTEDQLELRDDLFNHISLYHTIRAYQEEEDTRNEKHKKPG